jgi:hypothetical protein
MVGKGGPIVSTGYWIPNGEELMMAYEPGEGKENAKLDLSYFQIRSKLIGQKQMNKSILWSC